MIAMFPNVLCVVHSREGCSRCSGNPTLQSNAIGHYSYRLYKDRTFLFSPWRAPLEIVVTTFIQKSISKKQQIFNKNHRFNDTPQI